MDGEGAVWLTLRHRWSDGTTHLEFEQLRARRTAGCADTPTAHHSGVVLRCAGAAGTLARGGGSLDGPTAGRPVARDRPRDGRRTTTRRIIPSATRAYLRGELMRRTFGSTCWVYPLWRAAPPPCAHRAPHRRGARPASSRSRLPIDQSRGPPERRPIGPMLLRERRTSTCQHSTRRFDGADTPVCVGAEIQYQRLAPLRH